MSPLKKKKNGVPTPAGQAGCRQSVCLFVCRSACLPACPSVSLCVRPDSHHACAVLLTHSVGYRAFSVAFAWRTEAIKEFSFQSLLLFSCLALVCSSRLLLRSNQYWSSEQRPQRPRGHENAPIAEANHYLDQTEQLFGRGKRDFSQLFVRCAAPLCDQENRFGVFFSPKFQLMR